MSGTEALARLSEDRVDHRFKGLPPDADGLTVAELAAQRRNLFTGGFTTPVLALSAERLEHNLALMETYATRHGLAFAPHGKTTMAPQLFQRQIEHGAWGITLAVPHQVRVARAYGVQRVFLANELVDPAALRWIAGELAQDEDFRFVCYVDSVRGVELMDEALRGALRPVDPAAETRWAAGGREKRRAYWKKAARKPAERPAAIRVLFQVPVASREKLACPSRAEVPVGARDRVWWRVRVHAAVLFWSIAACRDGVRRANGGQKGREDLPARREFFLH